ncbi:uncharacterized protein LOC135468933 [Liolophura sinensis]|uniref:uncharacterized protein LOC135468933 n=1 Tax=Liolophura sinensis TaxID=3198878 RepID=UPI003158EC41
MKLFCVLASLLVVGQCSSSFDLCEDNDPRCTCLRPNKLLGTLRPVGEANSDSFCYCPCGQARGELCSTTEECAVGTYCGAPIHFETHADKTKGVCRDRCSDHHCPEFTICKLNTTGYPVCEASTFTCTRNVNVQVCAFDHLVEEIKYFPNMCYLVNEIFERTSVGNGDSLERRDCQTMAVIHSH